MNFYQYTYLARTQTRLTIDAEWAQGRSIFGGLTAALVLAHIEANARSEGYNLSTTNVHFCGATQSQTPCELAYQILSEGKSVRHVEGHLIQNGVIKTKVIACFTRQRASAIEINPEPKRFPMTPEAAPKMPFVKEMMPKFLQHFDLRYTHDNFPFKGSNDSLICGWTRLNAPTEDLVDSSILALIDAWPPVILPLLKRPAPTSTITWNIEFIRPRDKLDKEDSLYYECSGIVAGSGYAHSSGKMFHPNGQLLALTRQMIGVWDA
ncbi:MAG TPA: thioesterase family protein, partial [Porticoccaceae bacterium]|nr:thioesterase family protein [Porticoccaceae bacterium]